MTITPAQVKTLSTLCKGLIKNYVPRATLIRQINHRTGGYIETLTIAEFKTLTAEQAEIITPWLEARLAECLSYSSN